MSMFRELYQLALGATLTMTVSADEKQSKLTINVIPKPKTDAGEAALCTPLTLTASPEEFDAEFVTALTGFRVAHTSLSQQALVTRELLDAAKEVSAKKGVGAVASRAKPKPAVATKPTPASEEDESRDGDDGNTSDGSDADDDDHGSATKAPAKPAVIPAAPDREPQLFG